MGRPLSKRIEKRRCDAAMDLDFERRPRFQSVGSDRYPAHVIASAPGIVRHGDPSRLCFRLSDGSIVEFEPGSVPPFPRQAECLAVKADRRGEPPKAGCAVQVCKPDLHGTPP